MMLLVEHALILTVLLALALMNIGLGLTGIALGEYLHIRKQGTPPSFAEFLHAQVTKFWEAHAKGDLSPTVAVLIFAHVGVLFLFVVLIGPRNEREWVEPDKKIR